MANDNLSGMILTAFLTRELLNQKLNFSYRIVFVPETIGAIAYCANNEEAMKRIDCGLVITTVGGPGRFSYKQSFDKEHFINKLTEQTFKENNEEYIIYPFDIHGSDERQYSSPGFRINMATICKDRYYEYDYYHTSLDDLNFVKADNICKSLLLYLATINLVDKNIVYQPLHHHCEVMLSKHGLYPKTGGGLLSSEGLSDELNMMLWLFFYCDGKNTILDIAERTGFPMLQLYKVAEKLREYRLLKRVQERNDL